MFVRTASLGFRIFHDCCKGKAISSLDPHSTSKIVCVARNYSDKEAERLAPLADRMNDASIFMKPLSSITSLSPTVKLNGYTDVICETELALILSTPIPRAVPLEDDETILRAIGGVALAFDLTRKDLQNALKSQGKPWELAKAFDDACPMSKMIPIEAVDLRSPLDIVLKVNGKVELNQPTSQMILPVVDLVRTITRHISLWPGDIILTGTPTLPNQPPRLKSGDSIVASLGSLLVIETEVI